VYRPDGTLYAYHADIDSHHVPKQWGDAGQVRATVVSDNSERFRWASQNVAIAGTDYRIVLVASMRHSDQELLAVLFAMLLAGPIAIAASAFFAYGLARKSLSPVERIRRSTEAITLDRLYERLPIENPDDELGRLGQTVNAMVARLERSFDEVRRFTADASHELRTPLTVIRTEAEVALINPMDEPTQQQLLGSILEECGRMARLIDQLLTLAREDAGALGNKDEIVDLAALASNAVDALRPLAEAKGVVLETAFVHAPSFPGDLGRLRQVVINLLDNAIKYTEPGGKVSVRVSEQDGRTRLIVEDSGIGIPPEHLPYVFDRFYRVDKARSREMGGTGLGLSIARSIVAAHGGTIELTSRTGVGTVCVVGFASTLSDGRIERS
jgi:heavy metal sensor kinase